MDIIIRSISPKDHKLIINFYAKFGDRSYDWYIKMFKDDIISNKINGEICAEKKNSVLC